MHSTICSLSHYCIVRFDLLMDYLYSKFRSLFQSKVITDLSVKFPFLASYFRSNGSLFLVSRSYVIGCNVELCLSACEAGMMVINSLSSQLFSYEFFNLCL